MIPLKVTALKISRSILDFVYPPVCLLCGTGITADKTLVCEKCWKNLHRNSENTLSAGDRLIRTKRYFKYIAWCFEYNETVPTLIQYSKFRDYKSLLIPLGKELAGTIGRINELADFDAVVPVPLHPARLRERGYNQSEILSETVSVKCDVPMLKGLVRIKNTRPQSSVLGKDEKMKNVKGVFAVNRNSNVNEKRIILIDDVVTSGATVNECCKVLKKSGAKEIVIAAAAFAH